MRIYVAAEGAPHVASVELNCGGRGYQRAPSWSDTLRYSNHELRRMGVPARRVSALRLELTGHRRSMAEPWWMSVGLWGRVFTAEEIAHILGVGVERVRAYARGSGLLYATVGKALDSGSLAAQVYQRRDEPGVCRRFGILEVERQRYVLEVEAMIGEGSSFAGITSHAWRAAWAQQGVAPVATGLPSEVAARRAGIELRRAEAERDLVRSHVVALIQLRARAEAANRHGLPEGTPDAALLTRRPAYGLR